LAISPEDIEAVEELLTFVAFPCGDPEVVGATEDDVSHLLDDDYSSDELLVPSETGDETTSPLDDTISDVSSDEWQVQRESARMPASLVVSDGGATYPDCHTPSLSIELKSICATPSPPLPAHRRRLYRPSPLRYRVPLCEPTPWLNTDSVNSHPTLEPPPPSTDDSNSSSSVAVELLKATALADEQRRGSQSVWARLKHRALVACRFR
jgi:hypothetical protein